MASLSAHPPLEAHGVRVGRTTFTLHDAAREGRSIAVEAWYPAAGETAAKTRYEVLPGIEFESAGAETSPAVAPGSYPLLVLSHGRTGMRFNYSLLCEALAGRGLLVASCDHPGDVLNDWLLGTFVDDRTNEVNRVADTAFVIGAMLDGSADPRLTAVVDAERIATIGHSYGGYTGLAAVAGRRGAPPDARVKAVIGLQPYTRTLSDAALVRVTVPVLLILSAHDTTAPPATDGERPWKLVSSPITWRLDLQSAAHHASSDMGLYLELAGLIPNLPPMVMAYVAMMTPDMVGPHLRPWRENLAVQVRAIAAFLDVALGLDPDRGFAEAAAIAAEPGVSLQRR